MRILSFVVVNSTGNVYICFLSGSKLLKLSYVILRSFIRKAMDEEDEVSPRSPHVSGIFEKITVRKCCRKRELLGLLSNDARKVFAIVR